MGARKGGAPKGGAPKCGSVEGWGPGRVGPRRVGSPKFRAFFPLPPQLSFFLLSFQGPFVEFWWCLKRWGPEMCTSRDPERAHFRVPASKTPPKFNEWTPKREKKERNWGRERGKKRAIFSRGRMKNRGHTQNWRSEPHVTAIANHIRCGGRGPVRTQTSTAIQQGQGESPSGAACQHVPPPPEPRALGAHPQDHRLMTDLGFGKV